MTATKEMPKIALGAWAWGNDGTFGGNLTPETLRPVSWTTARKTTSPSSHIWCLNREH